LELINPSNTIETIIEDPVLLSDIIEGDEVFIVNKDTYPHIRKVSFAGFIYSPKPLCLVRYEQELLLVTTKSLFTNWKDAYKILINEIEIQESSIRAEAERLKIRKHFLNRVLEEVDVPSKAKLHQIRCSIK
jgi:hypothetical protein